MQNSSISGRLTELWSAEPLAARLQGAYGVPTIIIGSHRSGTSLVARMLRSCGGYFGAELDTNSEPVQLIRLNDDLLKVFGASWRQLPDDLSERRARLHRRAVRALLRRKHWLWNGLFREFGAPGREGPDSPRRLRPASLLSRDPDWQPTDRAPFWGWKDPRNTLTLSIWLELFPQARVVHVIRNGIDVAQSLYVRALRHGTGTPECGNLAHCFELWERYTEQGCAWRRWLPESHYIEISYETLLREPQAQLQALLRFVGASDASDLSAALALCAHPPARPLLPERAELERLAERSSWFAELGYAGAGRTSSAWPHGDPRLERRASGGPA